MASPSSVHEAKPHNETPELLWHQSNQTTIKSKSRQVKVLINLSPTQRTWKGMTWTIEGFQFAMDGRWCPLVNMFCTVQRKRTEVHLEHHSIVRWQDYPVVYPNSRSRVKWPTTDRTTDTMRLNCGVRWISEEKLLQQLSVSHWAVCLSRKQMLFWIQRHPSSCIVRVIREWVPESVINSAK